MDRTLLHSDEQQARIWVMGSRGKSTILAYLDSIFEQADRPVVRVEVPSGETTEPREKDILVIADTLPGEAAFAGALAAAHQARQLVLNAECPVWSRTGREVKGGVLWVGADGRHPVLREHLSRGGDACFAHGPNLEVASGACSESVVSMLQVPSLLGGAAQHQVRNAAAAALVGLALDLSLDQLAAGLSAVNETCGQRLGRGSSLVKGGARVLLDRVPDAVALSALISTASALPSERVQLMLGTQLGLDAQRWALEFERLALGGVHLSPGLGRAELAQAFAARGIPARLYPRESEARTAALMSRRPGDLLLALRCADESFIL